MRYHVTLILKADILANTEDKAHERAALLAKAIDLKWIENQDWVSDADVRDLTVDSNPDEGEE